MRNGWTRREAIEVLAGGAAAACVTPLSALGLAQKTAPSLLPLDAAMAGFRRAAGAKMPGWAATGLTRDGYLRVMDGIVRFFAPMQDARGAIIDPYEKKERQYSTPAFALAGATLCAAKPDADLLVAVVRALRSSCLDLADGKAADGHPDFFTVLVMHADRVLAPLAPASETAAWRADLARIVPEKIYRRQPTDKTINNWNLVAVAGEWMRTRAGLGDSRAWVEASLARQMPLFTECGMYRDPNDPMPYDHFARLWALDLVDEGYDGPQRAALDTVLERGAWASLLMQSPWGELPCGGRSAHHQWNEAEQAVTFESFARRFSAAGDRVAAAACKRAARLSLRSITRWVRPSGELWVVKNRIDPQLRHGYEAYSFHSQYNLLAAAMLAIAHARADDTIPEGPCPADTGGFAVVLQPAFHKVVANAGGTYVEIDLGADLHYNPTGVLRVHHAALPPETLSDGVVAEPTYAVPSKPARALALGPAWRDASGVWYALADHGAADLEPAAVTIRAATPALVDLEVSYRGRLRGGATAVIERITVTPGRVDLTDRVEGEVTAVRHVWPYLRSDGATETACTVRDVTARVLNGTGTLAFQALTPGVAVTPLDLSLPCRNGFMSGCAAEASGRTIATRVTIGPRG